MSSPVRLRGSVGERRLDDRPLFRPERRRVDDRRQYPSIAARFEECIEIAKAPLLRVMQEQAEEIAELRARMEDARWLARYYLANVYPKVEEARRRIYRILAHPANHSESPNSSAPAPATCQHEAWEERPSGARVCVDCREPLNAQATCQSDAEDAQKGEAEARMMFALVLHAAGGEIEIPKSILLTLPPQARILRIDDARRDAILFRLSGQGAA